MDSKNISYVLITPAHNEEDFIEKTIQSVIYQTVLPKKWAIVNDGSTDGTDDIIKRYAKHHDWIEFIRLSQHTDRQFAAKVHAFNAGYERIKNSEYAIIGNLDADISFEKDYFEFLLSKFNENGKLGVAGTPFVEESFKGYNFKFANIEHVSGACQLFRRECFESIGGYKPIRGGGIDWIAVTTARMKGWKTRTFTERTCLHHRKIGTGNNSAPMALFKQGRKDYFLGNHPLWEVFRTFYQMSRKPYVMGGLLLLFGFAWAGIKRTERPISQELMAFIRKEQMQRLKALFQKWVVSH